MIFDMISIGIKTFLRDEKLFRVIDDVRRVMPKAQLIIADCGDATEEKDSLYAELEREGHIHLDLPFDSGFGRMSNAIANNLSRPYLLVAADDFDFSPIEVRVGIQKLEDVLNLSREVDIASGRVNNRPYEFFLHELDGKVVETPVEINKTLLMGCPPWYYDADLTVNYSLIRSKVFDRVHWDDDVKIGGGEHGSWFLDAKRAGFKTVYVPGANINEQTGRDTPRYSMYRRRAMDPARPCFVKRGIKKYVLGNGMVDWGE